MSAESGPGEPAGHGAHAGEAVGVPCVYLLRCVDDSLYCGWTTDVSRRLAAHRAGTASRYTCSRRPVELAAAWTTATPREARSLEGRVKRLGRAQKLALADGEPLPGGQRLDPR